MRTWAEVSLDRLAHNYHALRGLTPYGTKFMGLVKADAYGHGAVPIAQKLEELGADYLGVACLAEAVELRQAGVQTPILILGGTPAAYAAELVRYHITQACYDLDYAKALSAQVQETGGTLTVHIQCDTGMSRLGFLCHEDTMEQAAQEIAQAVELPGLHAEGIFTHFSDADGSEEYTMLQFDRFLDILQRVQALGHPFAIRHCANSGALARYPEMYLDMVRPGIILYGEQPSADTVLPGLVPALRLRAAVSMVKELAAGDAVSYGCTFRAPKPMRAATLAVGYADGYPRALSGRGTVSLHGRPARVLGRVCMDQIVVDVTDIPDVKAGDAAIVFGGGAADSVDDVARMTGTINYEVLCDVGRRVQRVYVENGAEVELVDYLKGE